MFTSPTCIRRLDASGRKLFLKSGNTKDPFLPHSSICYVLSAMTRTHFSITTDIAAPQSIVWSVMADVQRWPEWTASISHVKMHSPGLLQVGSRVRIHQPKLPPAYWRVTELNPGTSFTWISRAPGVQVTACHNAETIAFGTRVTLSISYEGLLGALLARLVGGLNNRYLEMEANGLKARCAELEVKR